MLFGWNSGQGGGGGGGAEAHFLELSIPSYQMCKTGIDMEYSLAKMTVILSQLLLRSDELPI